MGSAPNLWTGLIPIFLSKDKYLFMDGVQSLGSILGTFVIFDLMISHNVICF